jgi:hypothetical protein
LIIAVASLWGLACEAKYFLAIAFYRLSLRNLRIDQDINFFPKQHYSPAETCNVGKVLSAGLALAQSVCVQPSEQPAGLFKANKK